MKSNDVEFVVDSLKENSILYVSINVTQDHPIKAAAMQADPLPDLDLNRLILLLGSGSRKYFYDIVIDGTCEALPEDLSGFSGLIIGCSAHSMNAADGPLEQWQKQVIDLVRRAVLEFNLPYLGICGGGQLGLTALGGKVGPNPKGVGFTPERERSLLIGTTQIELTEKGKIDPLFRGCKEQFGMAAIHADYMIDVPLEKGFTVLANSPKIPNQVVAYGDKVRLLGLHPEVTRSYLDESVDYLLDAGAFSSIPVDELKRAFSGVCPDSQSNYLIVSNFLRYFCAENTLVSVT